MINSVRQTVMSVLNKNNYGYISPSDFNLYAKQAQLDLFEDYFYQYNYQINKENARKSGTGYADITKGLEEVIDTFSETKPLLQYDKIQLGPFANQYFLPSQTTTSDDYYLINKVLAYGLVKLNINGTGGTTGISSATDTVIDVTTDFIALGIEPGDVVVVIINGVTYHTRVILVQQNALRVTKELFTTFPIQYSILGGKVIHEAEKVSNSKIDLLTNSILTAPTITYPAYTEQGLYLGAYPIDGLNEPGQIVAQYIRFPLVPKWTYVSLTNGEPSFDPSQPDYQDFELPNDDEVNLVNKILQYAGMSIREISATQFGQAEEQESVGEEK